MLCERSVMVNTLAFQANYEGSNPFARFTFLVFDGFLDNVNLKGVINHDRLAFCARSL